MRFVVPALAPGAEVVDVPAAPALERGVEVDVAEEPASVSDSTIAITAAAATPGVAQTNQCRRCRSLLGRSLLGPSLLDGATMGSEAAGATLGTRGVDTELGCNSGAYHLPSDASHQPEPCDWSLMSSICPRQPHWTYRLKSP